MSTIPGSDAFSSSALHAMSDYSPSAEGINLGGMPQLVVDRMGYGLAACDRRMVVLGCTGRASRLLEGIGRTLVGKALPSWLEHNLREAVRNDRPVRIEPSRGGRATYLSATEVEGMGPVVFVFWLRQEVVRESDLVRVLRTRYALTARDVRLLLHLRRGHTNRQIAARTGLEGGDGEGVRAKHLRQTRSPYSGRSRGSRR
jgi:hypothetical protein